MIQFIKCTKAQYDALATKADNFYYLTDVNKFYLKDIELSAQDLSSFLTEVKAKDNSVAITDKNEVAVKLSGKTGNALKLSTTEGEEGLLVEVPAATDYTVTVSKAETAPEGLAARYTIAQAATGLSQTIDIPKDLMVQSGRVETDAATKKTYIVLILNDADSTELKIDASSLIEYVTAGEDTATIHVAVSEDHKVTANVIDGSIDTTQLKDSAVSTDKIAAKAVTSAKLSDDVNASLSKADSALQKSDITTGSANGTISVDGDDVTIKGLGSAAYTESSAYATAAQGTKADSAVQSVTEGTTNGTILVDSTPVAVHGLGSAAYTATTAYDAAGSATTAETNAKAYADGLASNYDASGAATTAENNAKSYADGLLEWKTLS